MMEYSQKQEIALKHENLKKRNLRKCLYYEKGHCRRGANCWYKHSNSRKESREYYNKELYKNCNQFQHNNRKNANREQKNNSNDCDLTFSEGKKAFDIKNEVVSSKTIMNDFDGCTFPCGQDIKIFEENNKALVFKKDKDNFERLSNDEDFKKIKNQENISEGLLLDKDINYFEDFLNNSKHKEIESQKEQSEDLLAKKNINHSIGFSNDGIFKKTESQSEKSKDLYEKNMNHFEGFLSNGDCNEFESQRKKDEDILIQKNTNYSEGFSNDGDCQKIENPKEKSEDFLFENNTNHSKGFSNDSDYKKIESQKKRSEDLFDKNTNNFEGFSIDGDYKETKEQRQKSDNLLFEKNINQSQELSNVGDYKEIKSNLEYDEFKSKSIKNKEIEEDYKINQKKSQLTNTTTSSENPSALSSTASLGHKQGISSSISPLIQVSTQPQESQMSNLPPLIFNDKTEVLSFNPIEGSCSNISNSKSFDVSNPRQTSIQRNTLPPPSSSSHMFHSTPMLNKTTNIPFFNSYNIPSTQFQQPYNLVPQTQYNNSIEPSLISNTTLTMPFTNQDLLSSLENSQKSSYNMKCNSSNLFQNVYNMNLKHSPPMPLFNYPYHQTSILNELPQQQKYPYNNSLPQNFIHSSHLQNTYQSNYKESTLINAMQCNNKNTIPPPLAFYKWCSLTPTTTMYSMKPPQVKFQYIIHIKVIKI